MKKIYLATPYTSRKWKFWPVKQLIEFWRFLQVSRAAMKLMNKGLAVYSPISHTAPISWFGLRQNHNFWLKQDYIWLEQCDELWILTIEGWRDSYGILQEELYADEKGMPVAYIEKDGNIRQRN